MKTQTQLYDFDELPTTNSSTGIATEYAEDLFFRFYGRKAKDFDELQTFMYEHNCKFDENGRIMQPIIGDTKTVYTQKGIQHGLRRLLLLVNSYEPKQRSVLQKRVCKFTDFKDGTMIQYVGKAHDYSVWVKK